MEEKASVMQNEIRLISKYRSLIISKYYLTLLLSLTSLFLGLMQLPVSPLYILLLLNVLPPILSLAIIDYSQKHNNKILCNITQENTFQLDTLKSKYKYSNMNYFSNSTTYLITILLICLWQINYNNAESINTLLRKLPLVILISGLILRFLSVLIYRAKFNYDLSNNRV